MDLINRELGRYRVLSRLGAGGMGEAYRARDSRLERDVAIKVLAARLVEDETSRRRLRREALSLSRLNHPAIATVHDFDTVDGVDFLVMELIDGDPLAARIARGALPQTDALAYAIEIAGALEAAHVAGVIHRDLKPANVLITRANRVKVIDFGLAGSIDTMVDHGETRSTDMAGTLVGTIPYMSPEQLHGGAIDARSDIYALGVVLYEMVTGQRPFRESGMARLIDAILNRQPLPARSLSAHVTPGLDALIQKCLDKAPGGRPQTAASFAADLARIAAGDEPAAAADSGTRRATTRGLSLVVLPARVFGKDDDEFLGEAIPNALTTVLARSGGLDVRSSPTRHDVDRVGGDLARITAAYKVSACIVTSITATARKLSLDVQLVDGATRRILWAHEFHATRSKHAALVRDAARGIREGLNLGADDGRVVSSTNPSAGELGLQRAMYYSNAFVNRGLSGDLERAVSGFNAVLEANPQSAAALEGLAVLELSRVVVGASPADVAAGVEKYARRALAIDPRAGRAWSALSEVQPPAAPEGYRLKLEYALRGAALAPADDFTHGRLVGPMFMGSAWLALAAAHEAARLDPLVVTGHLYEAISSAVIGDHERGMRCIDTALALEPDSPFALYLRTLILVVAERHEEAVSQADALKALGEAGRLHPEWVRFAGAMARSRAAMSEGGRSAEELCAYLTAVAGGTLPFPRWQTATSGVPLLLARYGRRDLAVDLLLARRDAGLREPLDLLVLHETLASLEADPRYGSLVADAAAQFAIMLDVATGARARGEMPAYIDRGLTDLVNRAPIAAALDAASRARTGGGPADPSARRQ
jgi:serine/threonine protein kinase/tetratricopeptide (TPR) repeat protein